MRRFWLGLLLSSLVFLFAWNVLFIFFPMQIYNVDFAVWTAKFDLMKADPSPNEVVIIGDSGPLSSLPAVGTKRKTINLGLACAGPVEGFHVYERYRETHPPPRHLVIQYADFNLQIFDCLAYYALNFDFFTLEERAEMLAALRRHGMNYPIFSDDDWVLDRIGAPAALRHRIFLTLAALHLTPYHFASLRNISDPEHWRDGPRARAMTIEKRGQFILGQAEKIGEARTEDIDAAEFRPSPVVIEHLEMLMERATREGSKVVLQFDPFNRATVSRYSPAYRAKFGELVSSLRRKFPHAVIADFVEEWPDEAFGDTAMHVNATGAQVAARKLEELLDETEK